jgi:hypothetical protein
MNASASGKAIAFACAAKMPKELLKTKELQEDLVRRLLLNWSNSLPGCFEFDLSMSCRNRPPAMGEMLIVCFQSNISRRLAPTIKD